MSFCRETKIEVRVNRERCEGYGFCAQRAPDIFKLDDEGELVILQATVPDGQQADAEDAIHSCPVAALSGHDT